MAEAKNIKFRSRSEKPENIKSREREIMSECETMESELPGFLRPFFSYLKSNVLPRTRFAYLHDITSFCRYITEHTDITAAETIKEISADDLGRVTAADINEYIDYCREYAVENKREVIVYENSNRTLARKKSSLSVMFKQLYRSGIVDKNITDGFDPIRVPKAQEREIKALHDDEVLIMLQAVSTGDPLSDKERQYWRKTKKRDKAILMLFITYGLRLFELQQLNISSFNFQRGEFKIYRKRDKEAVMPLNKSVTEVLKDYIDNERMPDDRIKDEDKDALFLSLQGRRMTERQIRELVKKYTAIGMGTSKRAGYSPHKLRATAATSLIGRGNSIYDVQALLDHEQVTTTQLYAGHRFNAKRDLVSDMEWETELKAKEKEEKENQAEKEQKEEREKQV